MTDTGHIALPSYRELPVRAEAPPRSAWGLFGDADEVGTINLLTPDRVLRGIGVVRKGAVFSLNWPLELPEPDLWGRQPLRHVVYELGDVGLGDIYDNFSPAGSSQWDALSHIAHCTYGCYNGRTLAECMNASVPRNGIEHWARKGIAGRGVLLDVARSRAAGGTPIDPRGRVDLTADDLETTRVRQGVEIEQGDILLVRTGWMAWYERDATPEQRSKIIGIPGLAASDDIVQFLWDHHVAAAATDTPSFEAWPHPHTADEYLHFKLIPLLGMAIGELFYLEALAADCAADGVYECLFTAAPLNKRGGIGSPGNALAIK
jgi:kynurenine formamidase